MPLEDLTPTDQVRIDRICTMVAAMVKMDSPVEWVDAAIEMSFRIEAKVRGLVDAGR